HPVDLTPTPLGSREERERLRALIARHGDEAVAFQGTESGMRAWFDAPPPGGTGGGVAYVDTGRAWVAAGGPLGEDAAQVAENFRAAAARAGRRALFFGVERTDWSGQAFASLRVGEQPEFTPGDWIASRARHRSLS